MPRTLQIYTPREGARLFTKAAAQAQHSSTGRLRTISPEPICVKPQMSHFARLQQEAKLLSLYYPGSQANPMEDLRKLGRSGLALPTSFRESGELFLHAEGGDDRSYIVADNIRDIDFGRRKSREQFNKMLANSLSRFTLSRSFYGSNRESDELMQTAIDALRVLLRDLRETLISRNLINGNDLMDFTRADAVEFFRTSILDESNSAKLSRLVSMCLDGADDFYSMGQYTAAYQDATDFVLELSNLIQFATKASELYEGAEKDAYLRYNVLSFIGFLQQVGLYIGHRQAKGLQERIYCLLDAVPTHGLVHANEMKNHMLRMLVPANASKRQAVKFRRSRPRLENMGLDRYRIRERKKHMAEEFSQSRYFADLVPAKELIQGQPRSNSNMRSYL